MLLFYLREAKTPINFSQFIFSIAGLKRVHEIKTACLKRWLSGLSVLVVKARGHEFKSQCSYKSLAWTSIDRWRHVDLARWLRQADESPRLSERPCPKEEGEGQ